MAKEKNIFMGSGFTTGFTAGSRVVIYGIK